MGPLPAAVAALCSRLTDLPPGVLDGVGGDFRVAVLGPVPEALLVKLAREGCAVVAVGPGSAPVCGVHAAVLVAPAAIGQARVRLPDVAAAGVFEMDADGDGLPAGFPTAGRRTVELRDALAAAATVRALRRWALRAEPADRAAILDGLDALLVDPVARPLRLLRAVTALRRGEITLPAELAAEVDRVAAGVPETSTETARRASWWRTLAASAVTPALARFAEDVAAEYRLAMRGCAQSPAELGRQRDAVRSRRRAAARGYLPRLRTEIAKARLSTARDLAQALTELQRQVRAHVEHADVAARQALPAALRAAVGRLTDQLSARLTATGTQIHHDLAELLDVLPTSLPMLRLAPLPAPAVTAAPDQQQRGRPALLPSISGGVGLGRLALLPVVGLPALLGPAWVPLSVVLAAGLATWWIRTQRVAADRARLQRWAAEVITQCRGALDTAVAERLIDIEHRLAEITAAAADRRIAALDDELRRLDAAIKNAAIKDAAIKNDAIKEAAHAHYTA